jgi:hypothetical protein
MSIYIFKDIISIQSYNRLGIVGGVLAFLTIKIGVALAAITGLVAFFVASAGTVSFVGVDRSCCYINYFSHCRDSLDFRWIFRLHWICHRIHRWSRRGGICWFGRSREIRR